MSLCFPQELAGEGRPAGLGGAEGVPWCGAGSPYPAVLLGPSGAPRLEPPGGAAQGGSWMHLPGANPPAVD